MWAFMEQVFDEGQVSWRDKVIIAVVYPMYKKHLSFVLVPC